MIRLETSDVFLSLSVKIGVWNSEDRKMTPNVGIRRHNDMQRKRDRFVDSQMITVNLAENNVLVYFLNEDKTLNMKLRSDTIHFRACLMEERI